MKTIEGISVIESVDDFLHDGDLSRQFYEWQAENCRDFVNNPERAERCEEAAKDAADGSTHAEVIEDFREFGTDLIRESTEAIDDFLFSLEISEAEFFQRNELASEAVESCRAAFVKCCDDLEQWHEDNGTLNEVVG